jgi:hypothetical protein
MGRLPPFSSAATRWGRGKPAPKITRFQCKWGRHCCRPHSHRRVDALFPAKLLADQPPRGMQSALGARCLALVHPPCGWLPGVSSPALAPASGFRSCPAALSRSPQASVRAAMHSRLAEAQVPLPVRSAAAGGFRLSATSRSSPVPGLSGSTASRFSQTRPLAFGRSLVHAVSRSARGHVPPPSLGLKPLELQGLAAICSCRFVSRRQVESAPQTAIWQHLRTAVFHFPPDRLWTRVDKSTLRRISCKIMRTADGD